MPMENERINLPVKTVIEIREVALREAVKSMQGGAPDNRIVERAKVFEKFLLNGEHVETGMEK